MKKISLVIFNENYWSNSLIFSQNLYPLIVMSKRDSEIKIRLISFTSILMLLMQYKQIIAFKKKVKKEGVEIYNLPVLFVPSKLFIMRWFLFPFLYLNVFVYMICINIMDFFSNKDVYILRSYVASLIFSTLYFQKKKLVFDPRTDYIQEQVRINTWQKGSFSFNLWLGVEKIILKRCQISLFISKSFLSDVLDRHGMEYNSDKYHVIYNPVNFVEFSSSYNTEKRKMNFVYSGSLGNWNKLENYLDLYALILDFFPQSIFYILTPSKKEKIEGVLRQSKYANLMSHIQVYYNVDKKDVVKFYSDSTFGLQIMDSVDSRLGVKVVEYLAAGLIPIVSSTVLGAVEVCEKYNVGVILYSNFDRSYFNETSTLMNDSKRKERILDLSKIINIDDYSTHLYNLISIR